MPLPAPAPLMIDRITARVLSTLSPTHKAKIDRELHEFRHYGYSSSMEIRLDGSTLDHPQVSSMNIKVTQKRVETMIWLRGALVTNGRTIEIPQALPMTMLASLKRKAANDVIECDLLEGHTISYAREDTIHLKDEEYVNLFEVESNGRVLEPITMDAFLDRLEELGITQVDKVFSKYLTRMTKSLHILLARIEGKLSDNPEIAKSISGQCSDLPDYKSGESASFWIEDGKLLFTITSKGCGASYRAGTLTAYSGGKSHSAQVVMNLCHHIRRLNRGYNSAKVPNITIAQIRKDRADDAERAKRYAY